MFRCEAYRATMATSGCASRWREAQRLSGAKRGRTKDRTPVSKEIIARYEACRSCPIGAAHAGEEVVNYSWLYGAEICPRCRKGTTRMIGNQKCVSCYNRARELVAGKNARGNIPTELILKAPRVRTFLVCVDGVTTRKETQGVDLFEVMIQTLRTTKGEVAFAFQGPANLLRQGRLF